MSYVLPKVRDCETDESSVIGKRTAEAEVPAVPPVCLVEVPTVLRTTDTSRRVAANWTPDETVPSVRRCQAETAVILLQGYQPRNWAFISRKQSKRSMLGTADAEICRPNEMSNQHNC